MNLKKIKELDKVKSVNKTDDEITIDTEDFTYTQDNFGETLVMKTDNKTDLALIKDLLVEEVKKEFVPDFEWEESGRNYFLYNNKAYLDLDGEYFVLDKKYLDIESQIKLFRRNEDIEKEKYDKILSIIEDVSADISITLAKQNSLLEEDFVI